MRFEDQKFASDVVSCAFLDSPLGRLRLTAAGGALVGVEFDEHSRASGPADAVGVDRVEHASPSDSRGGAGVNEPVFQEAPRQPVDLDAHASASDSRGCVGGDFDENGGTTRREPVLEQARRQLEEFFAGDRERFDLPLRPEGTKFQRAVWMALLEIPFGSTRSYAEIARAIGRPAAVRAVGAANGRNPLAIIVPCHRVIGSNGSLTGYGRGLDLKRWLLEHEQTAASARLQRTARAECRSVSSNA